MKGAETTQWWLLATSLAVAEATNWQDPEVVRAVLHQAQEEGAQQAGQEGEGARLAGPFASYQEAEEAWRSRAWASVDDADLCWRIVPAPA